MEIFLRFLSYVLSRMTILIIIILLIILATFIGFDWANINVIANDGLAQRAEAVLIDKGVSELNKFFTRDFLETDSLLLKNPYGGFTVTNYDHRVKIKKIWVWPWQNKTKVVVEEIVADINGSSKDPKTPDKTPPSWESGEKIITLEKSGRWRISDITLTKRIIPDKKNQEND